MYPLYVNDPPPESYSRELDQTVEGEEMPYGYEGNPPSAATHDFSEKSKEEKSYPMMKRRK